jgi:hypothetical protein
MDQVTLEDSALDRVARPALIVGAVGLAIALVGIFVQGYEGFIQGYLWAYMFWMGITLGGLLWTMIWNTVGGRWGLTTRRLFEAEAAVIPLMAVLFLPILIAVLLPLLGLGHVYEWSDPARVAEDPKLQFKQFYLNVPFWIIRSVAYFAFWIIVARLLNKWSYEQERTGDEAVTNRIRRLSAPGILFHALALNFAATDWVMSLEPHWFSTMYGVIIAVGQLTSALALTTYMVIRLRQNGIIKTRLLTTDHFHDLGKLLFAFVILWTYTSYSQYAIIWSGNLSEFAQYYYYRFQGGWQVFFPILIVFHFFVPFFFLLSKTTKRRLQLLALACIYLLFMRTVDLYYIIVPVTQWEVGGGTYFYVFSWIGVAALFGIGGLWVWFFARQLKGRPLLILRDPRIVELYGERTGDAPSGVEGARVY